MRGPASNLLERWAILALTPERVDQQCCHEYKLLHGAGTDVFAARRVRPPQPNFRCLAEMQGRSSYRRLHNKMRAAAILGFPSSPSAASHDAAAIGEAIEMVLTLSWTTARKASRGIG